MKTQILLATLLLAAACAPKDPTVYFPAKGASGVNPDTHLTLTFPETPARGSSGFIRIWDAKSGECVDSLDMSLPDGLTQGRIYGPECDYTKTPYDYSRDVIPTNRNTVPGTPSGEAEPTPRDMQLTIIGGFTDGFRFHPVLIRDNTAVICLHNNILEYGHRYYVTVDPEAIVCNGFEGVRKGAWKFSTKTDGPADPRHLSVAADGSADFSTVQGALDAVPDFCKDTTWIIVAAGDYEEIVYARNKTNVVIRGAGMDETKVHYANNEVFNPHPLLVKTNEWPGTFPSRRAAFALDNCDDIVLEDIHIATDLYGQAEGLLLNGERIALYRVRITGSGDALQANGTVYMQDSELIGDGDTILGRGSLFAYRSRFFNHGGPFLLGAQRQARPRRRVRGVPFRGPARTSRRLRPDQHQPRLRLPRRRVRGDRLHHAPFQSAGLEFHRREERHDAGIPHPRRRLRRTRGRLEAAQILPAARCAARCRPDRALSRPGFRARRLDPETINR